MDFEQAANAIQQQVNTNNSWSAEQAQRQMDFQERMSNTAHQREVADLQAAGLNPVLSASHSGASTPSGAMAQGDNSGTSALVQIMSDMAQAENARAIAQLKYGASGSGGAGHGYSSASGYYKTNIPGAQVAQDIFTGATGKTPREFAQWVGQWFGDAIRLGREMQREEASSWAVLDNNGNPVSNLSGGYIPNGETIRQQGQAIRNAVNRIVSPFTNAYDKFRSSGASSGFDRISYSTQYYKTKR